MANDRMEGAMSIVATILLLFTAMLDPRISITLAVTALLVFGIYKLTRKQT
jgi:hypothetical protein